MIQVSIYGRLGRDPQERQTRSGNSVTTSSVAANATPSNYDGDTETIRFQVLVLGKARETQARHSKGDLVSLSGRIVQNRWTNQAGEEKTGMTIIADTIISAKSVRLGGAREKMAAAHKAGSTKYATNGALRWTSTTIFHFDYC